MKLKYKKKKNWNIAWFANSKNLDRDLSLFINIFDRYFAFNNFLANLQNKNQQANQLIQ